MDDLWAGVETFLSLPGSSMAQHGPAWQRLGVQQTKLLASRFKANIAHRLGSSHRNLSVSNTELVTLSAQIWAVLKRNDLGTKRVVTLRGVSLHEPEPCYIANISQEQQTFEFPDCPTVASRSTLPICGREE